MMVGSVPLGQRVGIWVAGDLTRLQDCDKQVGRCEQICDTCTVRVSPRQWKRWTLQVQSTKAVGVQHTQEARRVGRAGRAVPVSTYRTSVIFRQHFDHRARFAPLRSTVIAPPLFMLGRTLCTASHYLIFARLPFRDLFCKRRKGFALSALFARGVGKFIGLGVVWNA